MDALNTFCKDFFPPTWIYLVRQCQETSFRRSVGEFSFGCRDGILKEQIINGGHNHIKNQDLGLSVKLHQGLWHDLVRLCAKFVNISTHLLVELVGNNLLFVVVTRVNQIALEFDNNFCKSHIYIRTPSPQ